MSKEKTSESQKTENKKTEELKSKENKEPKSQENEVEEKKELEAEKKVESSETVNLQDNSDIMLDTENDEEEKKSDKSKKILGISFIVLGVIIISIVVYFLLYPERWRSFTGKTAFVTEESVDMEDELLSTEEKLVEETGFDNSQDNNLNDEQNDDLDEIAKIEDENVAEAVEEKKEEKTIVPDKWGLKLPCFVISHSAYSLEDVAKAQKAQLAQKGFKCGYYYIPDYIPQGKPLYKVYIGPFDSRNDAEKLLASAKKLNSKAYISEVNAE